MTKSNLKKKPAKKAQAKAKVPKQVADSLDTICALNPEITPRPHQAANTSRDDVVILCRDDMGTGKTLTALMFAIKRYKREGGVLRTIILVPNTLVRPWEEEMHKLYPLLAKKHLCVLRGSHEKRTKDFKKGLAAGREIYLTNLDTINTKFWPTLSAEKFYLLLADESHNYKSPKAPRTKSMIKFADTIYYKWLGTGTPVLKSMEDLWGQFRILDKSLVGSNYYTWLARWFVNRNANAPQHIKWSDWKPTKYGLEHLEELLAKHSVLTKLEEVADLPERVELTHYVQPTDEIAKAYKQMESSLIALYESEEGGVETASAEIAAVKTLRLAQLASGLFQADGGESRELKSNKDNALKELLEQICVGEGEQVIVWCWFRSSYERVRRVCKKIGLNFDEIVGGQSYSQRDAAVASFTENKSHVLISNPAAGGTGLNLMCAKYAIYYERNWDFGKWHQSRARNYRSGSEQHDKIVHITIKSDKIPGAKVDIEEIIEGSLVGKWDTHDRVRNVKAKLCPPK